MRTVIFVRYMIFECHYRDMRTGYTTNTIGVGVSPFMGKQIQLEEQVIFDPVHFYTLSWANHSREGDHSFRARKKYKQIHQQYNVNIKSSSYTLSK